MCVQLDQSEQIVDRQRLDMIRVETTTQPILCCMGVTVAGLPTQFLMERAFTAQGLDWRAISVEVANEKFETAIEGITAMKFAALRLFPTLEARGAESMLEVGSAQQFVGSVTSAVCIDSKWDAWNHTGYAIKRVVPRHVDWEHCICWLNGDSVRARSLVVALAVSGIRPKAIVWSEPPELDCSAMPEALQQLLGEASGTLLANGFDEALDFVRALSDSHQTADQDNESDDRPGLFLLADGSISDGKTDIAEQAKMLSELNCKAKIICGESPTLRTLADGLHSAVIIDRTELTIASEAYDFQRWTGYEIDQNLLRDAFDEYSDF